jgi:hypothetical protein
LRWWLQGNDCGVTVNAIMAIPDPGAVQAAKAAMQQ